MKGSKDCPHCGEPIDLSTFVPARKARTSTPNVAGTNRFANMSPEERKQAAAAMAAKRWGPKKSDPLNDPLRELLKEK